MNMNVVVSPQGANEGKDNPAGEGTSQEQTPPMSGAGEFLRNIGDHVASMLDPLGKSG